MPNVMLSKKEVMQQEATLAKLKDVSMYFLENLPNKYQQTQLINPDEWNISVDRVSRTFVETMYNGKYHTSVNFAPIVWTVSCPDFNMSLATHGKNIELFNIVVRNREKGLGTQLINILLDAADNVGISILLSAVPTLRTLFAEEYHLKNKFIGEDAFIPHNDAITKDTNRLIDFYKSFGFERYGKPLELIYKWK